MRKLLLLTIVLLSTMMLFAVDYVDVVEKKDGSILKGVIIENKINDFVKIELAGGSVFKVEYLDIESLKREKVTVNTSDSVVINNNNNNNVVSTNGNSGSNGLAGYDHFELVGMLNGTNLNQLNSIKLDQGLLRVTPLETRKAVYETVDKGSVGGYTVLNIFFPGVGSIAQGDKGRGWFTLITNVLCFSIGYSLIYNYTSDYADYSNSYSYYYGYEGTAPDEGELYLGYALISLASAIDIASWFRPRMYRNSYNQELKTKLMY